MDKKRLYGVMDNVNGCAIEIEKICRVVSLFKGGFEKNDNDDGKCAASVILDYLESVEKSLTKIYTDLDLYILDNK